MHHTLICAKISILVFHFENYIKYSTKTLLCLNFELFILFTVYTAHSLTLSFSLSRFFLLCLSPITHNTHHGSFSWKLEWMLGKHQPHVRFPNSTAYLFEWPLKMKNQHHQRQMKPFNDNKPIPRQTGTNKFNRENNKKDEINEKFCPQGSNNTCIIILQGKLLFIIMSYALCFILHTKYGVPHYNGW